MNMNEGSRKKDPTWKYTILVEPPNTLKHKCPFCGKPSNGGITRAKEHLIGTTRKRKNITLCPKVSDEVKEELKAYEEKQATIRRQQNLEEHIPDFDDADDMVEIDEEDDVAEIRSRQTSIGRGKSPATSSASTNRMSSMGSNLHNSSGVGGRGPLTLSTKKGSIDSYFAFDPALEVDKDERRTSGSAMASGSRFYSRRTSGGTSGSASSSRREPEPEEEEFEEDDEESEEDDAQIDYGSYGEEDEFQLGDEDEE